MLLLAGIDFDHKLSISAFYFTGFPASWTVRESCKVQTSKVNFKIYRKRSGNSHIFFKNFQRKGCKMAQNSSNSLRRKLIKFIKQLQKKVSRNLQSDYRKK